LSYPLLALEKSNYKRLKAGFGNAPRALTVGMNPESANLCRPAEPFENYALFACTIMAKKNIVDLF
jgi:hypothetical protein